MLGIQGDRGPGYCDCFVGISEDRINLMAICMAMGDLQLTSAKIKEKSPNQ